MDIWYIFPVLVFWTKKNLATLVLKHFAFSDGPVSKIFFAKKKLETFDFSRKENLSVAFFSLQIRVDRLPDGLFSNPKSKFG
jgi:hypothetical protein